mmetsp:Transcript_4305/g.8748  ORF Transcript_4305/g.8748 Transcript_4305/m.8748 type:complete len:287 (+) Transcript_4305:1777-2637(+)
MRLPGHHNVPRVELDLRIVRRIVVPRRRKPEYPDIRLHVALHSRPHHHLSVRVLRPCGTAALGRGPSDPSVTLKAGPARCAVVKGAVARRALAAPADARHVEFREAVAPECAPAPVFWVVDVVDIQTESSVHAVEGRQHILAHHYHHRLRSDDGGLHHHSLALGGRVGHVGPVRVAALGKADGAGGEVDGLERVGEERGALDGRAKHAEVDERAELLKRAGLHAGDQVEPEQQPLQLLEWRQGLKLDPRDPARGEIEMLELLEAVEGVSLQQRNGVTRQREVLEPP